MSDSGPMGPLVIDVIGIRIYCTGPSIIDVICLKSIVLVHFIDVISFKIYCTGPFYRCDKFKNILYWSILSI